MTIYKVSKVDGIQNQTVVRHFKRKKKARQIVRKLIKKDIDIRYIYIIDKVKVEL